jgi:hypothetical protein
MDSGEEYADSMSDEESSDKDSNDLRRKSRRSTEKGRGAIINNFILAETSLNPMEIESRTRASEEAIEKISLN